MMGHRISRDLGDVTSKMAAHYIDVSGKRKALTKIAAGLVERNPNCTYVELWEIHCDEIRRAGLELRFRSPEALMKRLNDCKGTTVVKGAARCCTVTGNEAAVWHPVPPQGELEV